MRACGGINMEQPAEVNALLAGFLDRPGEVRVPATSELSGGSNGQHNRTADTHA
jgi:hypothetical protein